MFTIRTLLALVLLPAVLLPLPQVSHAAQSYDNCTGYIDSLPATITTQGTWCMRKDVATSMSSGAALTIATNNVTVDCNDFKFGGLGAGLGTGAYGILAQGRVNITIRHCNVRGFYTGVMLQGAEGGGHLVEDNRFNNNPNIAVQVEGDGSTVRNNMVVDTGGMTPSNGGQAVGIYTVGSVDILGNTVSGVVGSGSDGGVTGILAVLNNDGSIQDNRVRALVPNGTGTSAGIYVSGDRAIIRENDVVGTGSSDQGIYCDGGLGRARDNNIEGFSFPLQCADSGGNDQGP